MACAGRTDSQQSAASYFQAVTRMSRAPKLVEAPTAAAPAQSPRLAQGHSMSIMKNRKFSTTAWSLLAAAAILCAVAPAKAQEKKPNIVFMLVDNLGYGELGVYGGGILRGAPTPRIDNLASEGMRLLNFNVESQCTPSRSALMTGRFPIRSGTYKVPLGGIPDGLTLWEVTIAELLSASGYATGIWGKWHLGSAEARFPTHQGFDEWYGIPRTYDEALWPSLNETNSMWPSVGNKQGWNSNVVPPRIHLRSA